MDALLLKKAFSLRSFSEPRPQGSRGAEPPPLASPAEGDVGSSV